MLNKYQSEFQNWIEKDHPVTFVKLSNGLRGIEICNLVMPCGGTHVLSLKELKQVALTDVAVNRKEKTVTVKYGL